MKPLSSKTIIEFLFGSGFNAEPVYVRTPSGDIVELTRMSYLALDDDDEQEDRLYPVFLSQYTDIIADIKSSTGEVGSELPPS